MKKLRCLSVFVLLAFAVPSFGQKPKPENYAKLGELSQPQAKKVVHALGKVIWKTVCLPAFVSQHLFSLNRNYRFGVEESLTRQHKKPVRN